MGFTDQRDSGLDEIDYVSAWIMRLAIGMMVLGALFAVLAGINFFHHFQRPRWRVLLEPPVALRRCRRRASDQSEDLGGVQKFNPVKQHGR